MICKAGCDKFYGSAEVCNISKKYYTLNERIRSPEVRVIGVDGQNLGLMKTYDALQAARNQNLDLVLIAESTIPPVAKILDFNKFLYEENKKLAKAKAKSKKSELKEFVIGPTTDNAAIEIRTKRAKGFIEDGNRVRVTVLLKGRQMAYPQLGFDKVNKFIKDLEDFAKPEAAPKQMGRNISVTLVKK